MRATKHRHYGSEKSVNKNAKAGVKHRKGIKIASAGFSFVLAAAALIVPTTTLAPGVNAYEDSRVASYSVGDIDTFSSVIKNNCIEVTTAPETEEPTTVEETTEEVAVEETEEKAEEVTKEDEIADEDTDETESEEEVSETVKEQSEAKKTSKTEEQSQSSNDESSSQVETEEAKVSYYGSALLDIANADPSYRPQHVSLSAYDRDLLERLVYGEAGDMGFTGCAMVAQTIRDFMVRLGTTSIDRVISECGYYGSTSSAPNSDVKEAVSFIFDQDGMAVQHRVLVFYNPSMCSSAWHESQEYIATVGDVRFFDMTY